MPRLRLLLCLAWLAAPAAGQAAALAAVEVDRVMSDLASEDDGRRAAAVKALGGTGDPRWMAFLAALRDGNVYVRVTGSRTEVFVGGARSMQGDREVIEVTTPHDGVAHGAVPMASVREVAADRRLRHAMTPFLAADEVRMQLADPDPTVRRGAAIKLGHQAEASSAGVIEAALVTESDRWVKQALTEALAVIRLGGAEPAARVEAARTLGDLHSTAALPALRALAVDRSAASALRSAAAGAVTQIERWSMLTATVETLFQGASLASILLLMSLGLAVVFGLMGVINMAHGELMALGA